MDHISRSCLAGTRGALPSATFAQSEGWHAGVHGLVLTNGDVIRLAPDADVAARVPDALIRCALL